MLKNVTGNVLCLCLFLRKALISLLRLKIADVQTAQIIGTKIYTVKPDNVLLSLLKPPVEEPKVAQQTVIMDDVNITNNNTTTIQGDVYVNMPKGLGW